MPQWIAAAIALLALAWLALLVAAPFLPVPLAGLLYAAGSLICHQIPERSFHLQSFQLPVCGRCFGLYAGGALGSVAAMATRRSFTWRRQPARKGPAYAVTLIAALPTLITVALEWGAGWRISNLTRALAAVPLAATIVFVVVSALPTLHYDECASRRPIDPGQPPQTRI